jgi:hypothetical protein
MHRTRLAVLVFAVACVLTVLAGMLANGIKRSAGFRAPAADQS